MKMQGHSNKLETNVENETQEFGIGDASVVIEILRNRLYENKIQTLCQEYICNARDAMREAIEAGKNVTLDQLEITVPNRLNPVFKVRDFGPGISKDRIKNVFVMYGASTKRGSNNQTGGFGIGAKSAWSYTDSFTIVTIVDGERRSYVAHTGVNNNGRLDLVSTDTTDEPNGTEIQIAVKPHDIGAFKAAILRAIYFWPVKPTLKGEQHAPVLTPGEQISDLVEVIDHNALPDFVRPGYSDSLAIIDGVPYPLTSKLKDKCKSIRNLTGLLKKTLVLHFGNGIVEVSASRESISDSEHSLAALDKLGHKGYLQVKTHIETAFAKAKSTSEYLNTYADMSKDFQVDKFAKFGSYSIEHSWIKSPLLKKVRITSVSDRTRRGSKGTTVKKVELSESRKEIEIKNIKNLFHSNTVETKVVQNKRMKEYLKSESEMLIIEPLETIVWLDGVDKDGKPTRTVKSRSTDMKSYEQVIEDLGVKLFQGITYVDPPKVPRAKGVTVMRDKEQICLHAFLSYHNRHEYTTLADNTQKWLWVAIEESTWKDYTTEQVKELDLYLKENTDYRLCGIAEKAQKIVQNSKLFTPLTEWMGEYEASKGELRWVAYKSAVNKEEMEILNRCKGVKDTLIADMISEYNEFNKLKIHHVPGVLVDKVKLTKDFKDFKDSDEALKKALKDKYALVKDISRYSHHVNHDELSFYINARYKSYGGK